MNIPKTYNPEDHEAQIYDKWEKSGFFNPDNLDCPDEAQNYCIVMPPPNVTGTLHMGHAGMLAYQDILIRYHRMNGYRTLWLPGTDHAAIATQTKVEKIIKGEGTDRHKMGREKFLERVEAFAKESHDTIVGQVKKMGSSCDWSREAYTLDETRTKAVRSVFKLMYEDGLIYRGERVVNWCPRCHSTLADDEVEYENENGKLYWLKYGPFVLATARPETKLGDTAVAVHPDDKRYEDMVGKEYTIKGVLGNFQVKVVADKAVDPKFGSGAIKVTPSHSFVDSEIAQRHNIPSKQVIDEDGCMMENCGKYAGMTTLEARKAIVKDIQKMDLIDHIEEDYHHNISICYRCSEKIEPIPSKQWFIDVNKKIAKHDKSIKELCIGAVKDGIFDEKKIRIIPKRFEKNYFNWINNLRDWCISRQIWYGHRAPVWHKKDKFYVGIEPPKEKGWTQDKDTLDTWFSSGLWTFSTLASDPKQIELKNGKLKINSSDFFKYHPTAVLETGYDILFFWVARMIIMTTYAIDDIPFFDVYLHGLVLDEHGKKMSKSKDNVIDPLDMIDKYGTDATRLSLIIGSTPGSDLKLSEEKVSGFRNLVNKLWNIGRFIDSKTENESMLKINPEELTSSDVWILNKFRDLIQAVTADIKEYRFSRTGELIRQFMWDDFADWYIESSKFEQNEKTKKAILSAIFRDLLKLWHPFIPFVTEKLWEQFDGEKLLFISSWPKKQIYDELIEQSDLGSAEFENAKKVVSFVRNARNVYAIEPSKNIKLIISGNNSQKLQPLEKIIKSLRTGINEIEFSESRPLLKNCYAQTVDDFEIFIPLEDVIDIQKEKERLQKDIVLSEKYVSSLENKLENKKFFKNAPKQVIEDTRTKLTNGKNKIKRINDFLAKLE